MFIPRLLSAAGATLALSLLPLFGPLCAIAFEGPLRAPNLFPLYFPFNPPALEDASLGNSFSASVSHGNVFMEGDSSSWSATLDMEITVLDLRYRRTVADWLEIGAELPVIRFSRGFLDGPLSDFHDLINAGNYGRKNRPLNSFLYEVRRGGRVVIRGEEGAAGIGDARLSAKVPLVSGMITASLFGTVEFPTGNPKTGFGSGSPDAGISILAEAAPLDCCSVFANAGAVFPGDLRAYERVEAHTYGYAGLGVEARIFSRFSLIGQTIAQTSPLPKTGIHSIDRVAISASFGGRFRKGNDLYGLFLGEDLNTNGAPDVVVSFSYCRMF